MLKAMVARGLTTLTTAVFGILAARLILGEAGPEYFALYALITALPSLLQFQDLGAGAALVTAIAKASDPESDDVRRTLLSVWRVTVGFAAFVFVLNAALFLSGGWRTLLGTPGQVPDAPLTVFFGLSVWALTIPLSVWLRILLGLRKNHVSVLIQGLMAPLNLAMLWLLLGAGSMTHGLLAVSAYVAGLIVALVGFTTAARQLPGATRWAGRRLLQFRTVPGTQVMDVGWPMLAQMLSAPLSITAQRYVLAQSSSPQSVAEYAAAAQVFVAVLGVISATGVALWPRFAHERAQGRLTRGPFLFSAAMAGGTAALCLLVWQAREPLFGFTTNGTLTVGSELVLAFGAMVTLQAALYPLGMFIMDKKGIRFQVIPTLTMAVSSLGLAMLITPHVGVAGPVLSNCVCVLAAQVIPYVIYIRRHRVRLWGGTA